jgi:hypothetical protein
VNILRYFAISLLLATAAIAQSAAPAAQPSPVPVDAKAAPPTVFPEVDAAIENNIYNNRYFGMTVHLPEGWGQQDWKSMVALVKDRVKDKYGAEMSAASEMDDPKKGLMLLTTRPKSSAGGPMLMILTVELPPDMPAARPEDFLVLATMPLVQNKFTISRQPEPFKVGGKDFARVELLSPDQKTTETMIFSITKNHALGFIFVGSDEGRTLCYEVLKTVTFADFDTKPAVSQPSPATK